MVYPILLKYMFLYNTLLFLLLYFCNIVWNLCLQLCHSFSGLYSRSLWSIQILGLIILFLWKMLLKNLAYFIWTPLCMCVVFFFLRHLKVETIMVTEVSFFFLNFSPWDFVKYLTYNLTVCHSFTKFFISFSTHCQMTLKKCYTFLSVECKSEWYLKV